MVLCNECEQKTKRIGELLQLLWQLTDDDTCSLDHHGYCQTHGWFDDWIKCANARARAILKEYV